MNRDDAVRAAAEAAHYAYETRAAEVGWETQERSRVAWADVPEANKQAMYAAMDAAAPHLTAPEREQAENAQAQIDYFRSQAAEALAEVERLRGLLDGPDCTCGFGGYHESTNPRCERNTALRGES